MNNISWKDKMKEFQTIDVRHLHGNFFEGLKKKAESLAVGQGLHIVQGFEPYPLYAVMEGLGYEHTFTARKIKAVKTTHHSNRLLCSTISVIRRVPFQLTAPHF